MSDIYKIGLAVIHQNRLLLCRPHAFDDLIMPGGIREGNESPLDNLRREIREELGNDATLDESSLRYLGNFSDLAAGRKNKVVEIELYAGNVSGVLSASSEIDELIWFSPLEASPYKLSAIVQRKIIPYLMAHGFLQGALKEETQ